MTGSRPALFSLFSLLLQEIVGDRALLPRKSPRSRAVEQKKERRDMQATSGALCSHNIIEGIAVIALMTEYQSGNAICPRPGLHPLGGPTDAAKGEDMQAVDRPVGILARHQRADQRVGAGLSEDPGEGGVAAGERA
jgi:hypothetical protein